MCLREVGHPIRPTCSSGLMLDSLLHTSRTSPCYFPQLGSILGDLLILDPPQETSRFDRRSEGRHHQHGSPAKVATEILVLNKPQPLFQQSFSGQGCQSLADVIELATFLEMEPTTTRKEWSMMAYFIPHDFQQHCSPHMRQLGKNNILILFNVLGG